METAKEIRNKYGSIDDFTCEGYQAEHIEDAMREYAEQQVGIICDIYNKPRVELKPLECLYRQENPREDGKFYLPDTTEFYKWIRIKIMGK